MIMLMDSLFIYSVLTVLGLMAGSFAGAWVWRLRARELKEDKTAGEKVNNREYDRLLPLTKPTFLNDRSQCLHCHHTLAWYDLIPLLSWLSTRGRCRYCRHKIGWFEPLIELATAIFFVASYSFWPEVITGVEILKFVLWLLGGVFVATLFAYDLKWYLLPNRAMFPLIAAAVFYAVITLADQADVPGALLNLCLAVVILSGLYFLLWVISKGGWIGFGDVKLGLALALFLGDWQLAFIALFAANLIGCLIVLPGMIAGKITPKTRVPFGPLLIAGGIFAMLFGRLVIEWYFTTFA